MTGLPARAWRDLLWLAKCPDLILSDRALTLPPPSARDEELSSWDPVLRHFESRAFHRVGFYAESLIKIWLEGSPGVSGVEHGRRIQAGKHTIGELDFLFRRNNELHHLEFALKFFLYFPDPDRESSGSQSRFRGPNAADNFEKKRDKLLQIQVPLGKRYLPEIVDSHVLMKGMIFYPPDARRPKSLPEGMNTNHLGGSWVRCDELNWLLESPMRSRRGLIMEKPFWLSGMESPPDSPPPGILIENLHAAVMQRFSKRDSPVLLTLAEESDSGWRETERIFVVPQKWPGDYPTD